MLRRRSGQGAGSKAIPQGYGVGSTRGLSPRDERATDDTVCLERVDLRSAEAELAEKFPVVLSEQRGVSGVQPLRTACEPHRQRAVARGPDHGMLYLFEEATEFERRQLGLVVRLHDGAYGHTGRPEQCDHLVRLFVTAPVLQAGVDLVVRARTRPASVSDLPGRQPRLARPTHRVAISIARRWRPQWQPRSRRGR